MTDEAHPSVISVMLAVPDTAAAARWYCEALGAAELWNLGGVVGLTVAGAPFFLGEPENNGWDTPDALGSRTVRVECSSMTQTASSTRSATYGWSATGPRYAPTTCGNAVALPTGRVSGPTSKPTTPASRKTVELIEDQLTFTMIPLASQAILCRLKTRSRG